MTHAARDWLRNAPSFLARSRLGSIFRVIKALIETEN
jgi:hypothetical protein